LDGTPLVQGLTVTGFADSEEVAVGHDKTVPYLIETRFKEQGAKYEKGDDWAPKVCVDGTLVTGQNPASSEPAAKKVVAVVAAERAGPIAAKADFIDDTIAAIVIGSLISLSSRTQAGSGPHRPDGC
jgi:hypothetical protein